MDNFLTDLRLLLPVLGFPFAQLPPASVPTTRRIAPGEGATVTTREVVTSVTALVTAPSPIFEMRVAGASARAQEVNGQFVVLAGSTARREALPSLAAHQLTRRGNLQRTGKLIDNPEDDTLLIFAQDVAFDSPSGAAVAIAGRPSNGRKEWRVPGTQQTYAEWADAQIARVDASDMPITEVTTDAK